MSGRNTFGFILIALGVILIVNQVYDVALIRDWWPMALVLLGAYLLVMHPKSPTSGIILAVGGGAIQLIKLGVLDWDVLFPIVLIVIGLLFIFTRFGGKNRVDMDEQLNHFIIFSGLETRNQSSNFKGGCVTAMFGGATIDLRDAVLSEEGGSLDIVAAFGGVELSVPEDWAVKVSGVPLFGGFENSAGVKEQGDKPVLRIKGLALFGGVEIKN